ncbi:hypothetical protein [Sandaracinus amylolyticus]|uniref:Uncharacterized protein n=1 Tax=Sandaracinus amylolyticus TaxID=927083 RepID=A0A0F6W3A3_9BACT|nr:hypothetical protein [Sandaracinus amylolyticus]AKF06323.1 hypothetical protein DB32_003472 [Sandaracinus amylolyticus]
MAGISDSGQPDDVRIHLEVVAGADATLATPPDGVTETEAQRRTRESVRLPAALRARLDAVLAEVRVQVPGVSASELVKLEATRAGRDALAAGVRALARVDSHLQSRAGERNPAVARAYGVHGVNPDTFGGVLRALGLSAAEDARLAALPEAAPERELLFTPVVSEAVQSALASMNAVIGATTTSRADLSRAVSLKETTLREARAVLAATREHLYANLPDGKRDHDLRDYGFRPLTTERRRKRDDDTDPGVEPPTER